jgi:hypothetical protein
VERKKRKASGPNPLAMKKKKKGPAQQVAHPPEQCACDCFLSSALCLRLGRWRRSRWKRKHGASGNLPSRATVLLEQNEAARLLTVAAVDGGGGESERGSRVARGPQ